MPNRSLPVRVAVVGNHLPRQCGIATFTTDLCDAITAEFGTVGLSVAAVNMPRSPTHTLHGYESTWHAAELLDHGRGVLVPFEDPASVATTAIELLDDDALRQAMRKRAYLYERQMVWNRVAQSYVRSFTRAHAQHAQPAIARFPVQPVENDLASRISSA
jgi:hypothetical protein